MPLFDIVIKSLDREPAQGMFKIVMVTAFRAALPGLMLPGLVSVCS